MSETNEVDNLPVPFEGAGETAARMRMKGQSFTEIADELNSTPVQVYGAIRARFKREAQFLAEEEREMLLMIENERFDFMLAKLWPAIEYGDLDSIKVALAISDRRLKWNHMDQPSSVSTTQVLVVGGESKKYIERLKELSNGTEAS